MADPYSNYGGLPSGAYARAARPEPATAETKPAETSSEARWLPMLIILLAIGGLSLYLWYEGRTTEPPPVHQPPMNTLDHDEDFYYGSGRDLLDFHQPNRRFEDLLVRDYHDEIPEGSTELEELLETLPGSEHLGSVRRYAEYHVNTNLVYRVPDSDPDSVLAFYRDQLLALAFEPLPPRRDKTRIALTKRGPLREGPSGIDAESRPQRHTVTLRARKQPDESVRLLIHWRSHYVVR